MRDDEQTTAAAIAQDTVSTEPRVHVRSQWSVQDFPAHLEPGTDFEIKTPRRDGRIVLAKPKLLDPGDANAGGDLDKRCARQVGVLATCRCPARHLAVR
jgi:hypothetical protein